MKSLVKFNKKKEKPLSRRSNHALIAAILCFYRVFFLGFSSSLLIVSVDFNAPISTERCTCFRLFNIGCIIETRKSQKVQEHWCADTRNRKIVYCKNWDRRAYRKILKAFHSKNPNRLPWYRRMGSGSGKRRKTASMHGNSLGISIKQRTKQYSKGEQLSPSAFAISRIPTCQKVSLWTKTELPQGFFYIYSIRRK